jgi:hypothetical protein
MWIWPEKSFLMESGPLSDRDETEFVLSYSRKNFLLNIGLPRQFVKNVRIPIWLPIPT